MDTKNFHVEVNEQDPEQLIVDLKGLGTLYVLVNEDGLSLDVYPLHVVDEPILANYCLVEDFYEQEAE